MRLVLGLIFSALLAGVVTAGPTNLLVNADMSVTDGLGAPCGWQPYEGLGRYLTASPLSNGIIRLSAHTGALSVWQQRGLTLRPGARYRYSAEVMTTQPLRGDFALQYINHYWVKAVTVAFPKDTKGAWRRVAWEGAMIESRDEKDYSFGFQVSGGKGPEEVLVRNVCLEPLDDEAKSHSVARTTSDFRQFVARIIPVDPLLTKVDAERAAFTFRWFGTPPCGRANCTLDGRLGTVRRTTRLSEDGVARLDFGTVAESSRRLKLAVVGPDGTVLATNSYAVAFADALPKGPAGRRLNNFVTELVRAPLADGTTRFFRAADGWVWINFTGGDLTTARAYLDDGAEAVVRYDPDDAFVETMRFVPAGWHTLRVVGTKSGGLLRIHAVKTLGTALWSAWTVSGAPCCAESWDVKLTLPFLRRYVLPANNTILSGPRHLTDPASPVVAFYASRGRRFFSGAEVFVQRPDFSPAYVEHALMDGMWSRGWSIQIDELAAGGPRAHHVWTADALWKMYDLHPEQSVLSFCLDAMSSPYDTPSVHVGELAAIVNLGNGTGVVAPELYAATRETKDAMKPEIDRAAEVVRNVANAVPGARGRTYLHMNPYMQLGHYTTWNDPEVDVRAFYAHLMQTFATDPRFAENAGIGGGVTGYCEEELVRWYARLKRYYGVEGGTENLAEKMGFAWRPEIIPDGDFKNGLGAWQVRSGEVKCANYRKYGSSVQVRKRIRGESGDTVAEFTTSAEAPSRLACVMKGLEKGRYYKFACAVANAAVAENPGKGSRDLAFRADIEKGGARCDALSFFYRQGSIATVRVVFQATDTSATVVLEDRDAAGKSLAPGLRQVVNFVTVRPYYLETPDEIDALASYFSPSTVRMRGAR